MCIAASHRPFRSQERNMLRLATRSCSSLCHLDRQLRHSCFEWYPSTEAKVEEREQSDQVLQGCKKFIFISWQIYPPIEDKIRRSWRQSWSPVDHIKSLDSFLLLPNENHPRPLNIQLHTNWQDRREVNANLKMENKQQSPLSIKISSRTIPFIKILFIRFNWLLDPNQFHNKSWCLRNYLS